MRDFDNSCSCGCCALVLVAVGFFWIPLISYAWNWW
jgi:hypothetical protein